MKEVNVNMVLNDVLMGSMNDNMVPTGVTINGRVYYELKVFCKKYKNHSESKVRRKLRLLERSNFALYVYRLMNKLFVSEALLSLNLDSLKKTKDIKGNYLAYLSGFEWDYFGCVRYAHQMQLNTVKMRMERLAKKLATKFKQNEIRLFYTIERNPDKDGYHAHFLLWTDADDKTAMKQFAENSLRGKSDNQTVNTFMEPFNPDEGGVAYILKEINLNPDGYDLIWKL
jgi:hypothetical protein